MVKEASSQAAWALLTEGVTRARVEVHRFQHLVGRATKLVEASEEKEHIFQVAGDIVVAMPVRLENIVTALDRTALALSKMGAEFLESRLSLADKTMVNEAVESAFGATNTRESAKRVAARWLAQGHKP